MGGRRRRVLVRGGAPYPFGPARSPEHIHVLPRRISCHRVSLSAGELHHHTHCCWAHESPARRRCRRRHCRRHRQKMHTFPGGGDNSDDDGDNGDDDGDNGDGASMNLFISAPSGATAVAEVGSTL